MSWDAPLHFTVCWCACVYFSFEFRPCSTGMVFQESGMSSKPSPLYFKISVTLDLAETHTKIPLMRGWTFLPVFLIPYFPSPFAIIWSQTLSFRFKEWYYPEIVLDPVVFLIIFFFFSVIARGAPACGTKPTSSVWLLKCAGQDKVTDRVSGVWAN